MELSDGIYDQQALNSQKHGETGNVEEESTSQYERIFDASETVKPAEKGKEEDEEEEEKEEETLIEPLGRNEENQQVAESQQQFSKQLVQPYVVPLKAKSVSGNASSESADIPRSTRVSQVTANETFTVEYVPSQEIILQDYSSYNSQESSANDLSQTVSKGNPADVENVGEFGQRVRSSSPQLRSRNNDGHRRLRNKQSLDAQSSSTEDQRKQYRKNFRSYVRKLNVSSSDAFPKDRSPFSPAKNAAPQRSLKQKETDNEGDHIVIKDASSSTSTVPLGKFSGPIVVPDLPRQKKYSYATTVDYIDENNEVSRPAVVESATPKVSETLGYQAAPPVVLNPLQVGVALMNAGQDLVNGEVTLTKLYPQEEPESQEATEIGAPSLIQSDVPGNLSSQSDQVGPVKSVEIQKSVEIYHTAPIQEIHYPVEFVPNVQQLPLVKQRGQEDQRKPGRGQLKEQRQNQVNVYKSNEILDESVSLNSQERGRYEYNANENDVVYSATSGQVDQAVAVAKPPTAVFGAKEQVDGSSQYDQVTIKHSKLQGVPEINVKQGSYEAAAAVAQPPRGVESVPSLASPENLQEPPQQILLTKVAGEPPAELRLLMYHHPAEKNVHPPQTVDVVEKKVPYAVEKVIEKQITIPQPFPVHIPIDRVVEKQIRIPYPVHVEKVIEKKVPLAVQRFIIPLPIHFRVPQPVPIPVKKVVEKPVPIPVPVVEKIVEKPVHLTRPYTIEIEKSRPYTLESTKLVKSVPIYNVQPDVVGYQQPVRQNFQTPVESTYASDGEQGYYNSTSQFYGPGYLNLNRPHARQPTLVHALPKKFATSYSVQYPHSVIYSVSNGNLLAYGRAAEKDKLKDEYVGPVPRKTSIGIQSKSLYSSPDAVQATLRRTRQEAAVGNTGSFRQSKMEYGFKPPMVPSVQYDEQTATKVE
ncbi:hypothetical protein E2986_03590 [Frieseomelitta varia]|uniref:Uncharacterized protein n=1 Tax=Frieseomelitta varia TaxID=561572 RepID=A0A833S7M9_9HYME|nr:hypothetical protein E2986_03590 [Frieseomelitta varia]